MSTMNTNLTLEPSGADLEGRTAAAASEGITQGGLAPEQALGGGPRHADLDLPAVIIADDQAELAARPESRV